MGGPDALIPSPPPSGPGDTAMDMSPPSLPPPQIEPYRVSMQLMVVPEGKIMRRGGLPLQNVILKFVGARSGGKSERQAVGKTRQPLINDLHVGTLYSDLKESQRKYKALKVEYNQENIARLRSDLRIAIKDANTAYDILDTLPEFLQEKG